MKRKLKDLKENECIFLNNEKEAKKLKNALELEGITYVRDNSNLDIKRTRRENVIYVKDGMFTYYPSSLNFDKELNISKFIKPKKSAMKKAIKELRNTCKELAETQEKTNEYLEVLNGKNEPIGNSEQFADSSKMEHSELEAGKWYGNNSKGLLIYITDLQVYENVYKIIGFGFCKGVYYHNIMTNSDIIYHSYSVATPEEVESALIKEAKKKGFKEGVKICRNLINKSSNRPPLPTQVIDIRMFENDPVWHYESEENFLEHYGLVVFDSGIWAEIISEEQTIGWSKPGQLVVDECGGVVMVSEDLDGNSFKGVIVKQCKGGAPVGVYYDFTKSHFNPYNGTITLKND